MLVRIKQKMRRSLEELPNYTCLQRIQRTRLSEKARRKLERRIKRHNSSGRAIASLALDSTDTIEVEVAVVDDREIYSWPGANRFEERELSEIVGFGTVGTGQFAQHARALFLGGGPSLKHAGEEALDGRRVVRYDYQVPLFRSGYTVSDGSATASVPYEGSIWADADSADLVRIEVRAEEVPWPVSVHQTSNQIDYVSVALDGEQFLLPHTAWLVTRFRNGQENINRTEFQNCRTFGAESELSFGEEPDSTGIGSSWNLEEFELPVGVDFKVRLDTEITSEGSVVGNRVEATLRQAVLSDGEEIAPKGSALIGRIRRLERFTDPKDHFILGLEFTELRTPTAWARAKTELVHVAHFRGLVKEFGEERTAFLSQGGGLAGQRIERTTVQSYSSTPLEGTGEMYIEAKRFRIRPGLHMVWKTISNE